jgi:hypothetical protein
MYRFGGRLRRITYGVYPGKSLAAARVAHAIAREKVRNGIDPGAERAAAKTAERAAETIADLAREYMNRHARRKKKGADWDERTLNREVISKWGGRKARMWTADGIGHSPVPGDRAAAWRGGWYSLG